MLDCPWDWGLWPTTGVFNTMVRSLTWLSTSRVYPVVYQIRPVHALGLFATSLISTQPYFPPPISLARAFRWTIFEERVGALQSTSEYQYLVEIRSHLPNNRYICFGLVFNCLDSQRQKRANLPTKSPMLETHIFPPPLLLCI